MTNDEVQVLIEQMVSAVASLSGQVADLIDERSGRAQPEDRSGIAAKAIQVRQIADSLRSSLHRVV